MVGSSKTSSRRRHLESPLPALQRKRIEIKPRKLDTEADAAAGSKKDKVMPSAQPTEEPSEEASLQRLRRLCEVKPSGRCNVPPEMQRWKAGTKSDRLDLVAELEKSGWSKDRCSLCHAVFLTCMHAGSVHQQSDQDACED